MKAVLAAGLVVLVSLACARYKDTVMAPWLGAPEDELVAAWGYPSSRNDIVTINDQTKVYTYRYATTGPNGGPSGKPNGTSPVSRLDFDLTFRPLPASPVPPRPLRTQRA